MRISDWSSDVCSSDLCWTGTVDGLDVALSGRWAEWDCRIHRLAALALEQDGFRGAVADAVARHGADRVAVFIGTSTAGTLATEHAYRQLEVAGRLQASSVYRRPPNPHAVVTLLPPHENAERRRGGVRADR